jgi:hypothetical protein
VNIKCSRTEYNEINKQHEEPNSVINDDSILETELDSDELYELGYIAVRHHVKEVINDLVKKLIQEATGMKTNGRKVNILQPTWSEIVVGVKSSSVEVERSKTYKIATVETTQVHKTTVS